MTDIITEEELAEMEAMASLPELPPWEAIKDGKNWDIMGGGYKLAICHYESESIFIARSRSMVPRLIAFVRLQGKAIEMLRAGLHVAQAAEEYASGEVRRLREEAKPKKYRVYWLDGSIAVYDGIDAADALNHAGFGGGAVGQIDYWEEIE